METNKLYKVTNILDNSVIYCINLSHVCYYIGCNVATRYTLTSKGYYKNFKIEEIDGSDIKWSQIYKRK